MTQKTLFDIEDLSEQWCIPESSIMAYIDSENDYYDPTFPKPFSRDGFYYWDHQEMHEWHEFHMKLIDLSDQGFIKLLKFTDI